LFISREFFIIYSPGTSLCRGLFRGDGDEMKKSCTDIPFPERIFSQNEEEMKKAPADTPVSGKVFSPNEDEIHFLNENKYLR